MNNRFKLAFTLIELLVVIAIIGILSGLIIVGMSSSVSNAKLAKAQIFSSSIKNSLLANIVSEWTFNTATIGKDSWSASDCTATGTTPLTSGCVYGNCLSFTSSSSEYLNCGTSNSLNIGTGNWAISVWVKASTPGSNASRIVFKVTTTPATQGYNFSVNPSGYISGYIAYNGSSPTLNSTRTLLTNTGWHFAVFSIDRNTTTGGKLYIDGELETQGNFSTIPGNISNSVPLEIGRNTLTPANSYYNGLLDDVRIYSSALPTSIIKAEYYAGLMKLLSVGEITREIYFNKIVAFAD